jgi:hypothetical protein
VEIQPVFRLLNTPFGFKKADVFLATRTRRALACGINTPFTTDDPMTRILHRMKSWLPAVVSGALLLAPECRAADRPGTDEARPATRQAGPEVKLATKWRIGHRYTYRAEVAQKNSMRFPESAQMPRMPRKMDQRIEMASTYSLTPVAERPGGGMEVVAEFLALEMDFMMGDRAMMSFDSKSGDASAEGRNPFTETFRQLIGAKFRLILDPDNSIESIEGFDEWTARASDGGRPEGGMMLRRMFGTDYFQQLVEFARGQPGHPVRPGESWPSETVIAFPPMDRFRVKLETKMAGMERREDRSCARLEFTGTLAVNKEPSPRPERRMIPEEGRISGTSWFDPELGILVESAGEQSFKQKIEMPQRGGGADAETAVIHRETEQKTTLKLVELQKSGS